MPIETQIVVLYAATKGYLDRLSVANISQFEENLLREMDPAILTTIREQKAISPELDSKLKSFFDGFTARFLATVS